MLHYRSCLQVSIKMSPTSNYVDVSGGKVNDSYVRTS